jgi:periplasmic divalent cation tolerance protein
LEGAAGYVDGMNTEVGVVMTTFPDAEVAARVLDGLLEKRLAACVQSMPIQSAYRWQGVVNRESEVLALIKTRRELFPEVESYLRAAHPYEVPEILLLPATAGSAAYLQWIAAETK